MLNLVFIITAAYEPKCGSVHVAHASVGSMAEGGGSARLLPETYLREILDLLVGNYLLNQQLYQANTVCFNLTTQLIESFTLHVMWLGKIDYTVMQLCIC